MVARKAPGGKSSAARLSPFLAIIDVALQHLADEAAVRSVDPVEEAVLVGEEMNVEVERISGFPLPGHDQDQAPAGDPPEIGEGAVEIREMLEDVRADDCVERFVGEGQPPQPAFGEGQVGGPLHRRRRQVHAHYCGARTGPRDQAGEVAPAAAGVEHGLALEIRQDPLDAGAVEIAFAVDGSDRRVEAGIFLRAHRPDALAEGDEAASVAAPDQVHERQEERRIPKRRRSRSSST